MAVFSVFLFIFSCPLSYKTEGKEDKEPPKKKDKPFPTSSFIKASIFSLTFTGKENDEVKILSVEPSQGA